MSAKTMDDEPEGLLPPHAVVALMRGEATVVSQVILWDGPDLPAEISLPALEFLAVETVKLYGLGEWLVAPRTLRATNGLWRVTAVYQPQRDVSVPDDLSSLPSEWLDQDPPSDL